MGGKPPLSATFLRAQKRECGLKIKALSSEMDLSIDNAFRHADLSRWKVPLLYYLLHRKIVLSTQQHSEFYDLFCFF
jgi:hypothetical protein